MPEPNRGRGRNCKGSGGTPRCWGIFQNFKLTSGKSEIFQKIYKILKEIYENSNIEEYPIIAARATLAAINIPTKVLVASKISLKFEGPGPSNPSVENAAMQVGNPENF